LLDWFGPALTSYDRRLPTTWATSVERLSPESRRLLDRLAMLAPDPIPDSLLDVAVPGEAADYDVLEARAGLYAYSLIVRATGEDGSATGFVMHRLVQDFARRAMTEGRRGEALREALGWVNGAVPFDSDDVRTWPVLDPLAPHALAVARRADETGIADPTGRLLGQLALLSKAKARYAEAEPLFRRSLAIGEATLGSDDRALAIRLNNLATLLHDTNRPGEAESLFRRALAIWEKSLGPDHPQVAIDLNNLAELLRATNRLGEAEPLYRRALAIDEASYGSDHPEVATGLNNLAGLAPSHEPRRRGGAAVSARVGDRRGELRAGSPQCRDPPQQSRGPAPSHESPRRSRAALSPRAGDFRKEFRDGSSEYRDRSQEPRRARSQTQPPVTGGWRDAARQGTRLSPLDRRGASPRVKPGGRDDGAARGSSRRRGVFRGLAQLPQFRLRARVISSA